MTKTYETADKKIGKRFHMFVVLEILGSRNNKKVFLCQCDCGNKFEGDSSQVHKWKSCGCRGRNFPKRKTKPKDPTLPKISSSTIHLSIADMGKVKKFYLDKVYSKEKLMSIFNITDREFEYIMQLTSFRFAKNNERGKR